MFYWSWSTYFCAFGVLISLHFYIFRDRYTVHPRLFADDGAFILASTLVARSTSGTNVLARIKAPSLVQEMDLDAHSAWLSPAWRSAFVLGTSTCRDRNRNLKVEIRTWYISLMLWSNIHELYNLIFRFVFWSDRLMDGDMWNPLGIGRNLPFMLFPTLSKIP